MSLSERLSLSSFLALTFGKLLHRASCSESNFSHRGEKACSAKIVSENFSARVPTEFLYKSQSVSQLASDRITFLFQCAGRSPD
jgi:hypothetical protein